MTLVCGDQQLQAHKLVLAASSPLLLDLLLANPDSHSLIHLCGVKFSALQQILRFIYHGEVVNSNEQLDSFMDIGLELQVKGLTKQG